MKLLPHSQMCDCRGNAIPNVKCVLAKAKGNAFPNSKGGLAKVKGMGNASRIYLRSSSMTVLCSL